MLFHYSAWNNCSVAVQSEGCTFYDLVNYVLQNNFRFTWYRRNTNEYIEAVDAARHLCSNIEPGTNNCKTRYCLGPIDGIVGISPSYP